MNSRRDILKFDDDGQDGLDSEALDRILSIQNVEPFTVTSKYASNPQLLAFERYNSPELYFVILFYNGIGNSFDFTSGRSILIPNPTDVRLALSASASATARTGNITL